jgi:hypothetical protein
MPRDKSVPTPMMCAAPQMYKPGGRTVAARYPGPNDKRMELVEITKVKGWDATKTMGGDLKAMKAMKAMKEKAPTATTTTKPTVKAMTAMKARTKMKATKTTATTTMADPLQGHEDTAA